MKIAVTGVTGRVGAALVAGLEGRHQVQGLSRRELDLRDIVGMEQRLDRLQCEVLLHPAAMTSLEACEMDPEGARLVNEEATGVMAQWAEKRGVKLVYFSTDYVFGGQEQGKRSESESVGALSVYGRTKAGGEQAVLAGGRHLVMRVSWVFGPEKASFVDGVMERALNGEELRAIADKWSLPTYTKDLVGWVERLVEADEKGVVHACQGGEPVSWHGMAEWVVQVLAEQAMLAGREIAVERQRLAEMAGFLAERPIHTAMATDRLAQILGGGQPRGWREALEDYVKSRLR